MSFRPFSEPGDGAIYERFADDARYSIHITDPKTGVTRVRYDFAFSPVDANYKNRNTILSYGLGREVGPIMTVGDARQNFTQKYRVVRVVDGKATVLRQGMLVPPPNVGNNVTPAYNDANGKAVSGALTAGDLDIYTRSTIYSLKSGEAVWAGPRDDSFFADIPGIFDLLNVRILDNNGSLSDGLGQDGNGVDGFKGFNLLSIAMQIPVSDLEQMGIPAPYDSVFFGQQTGVGVYASVSRARMTERNPDGTVRNFGGWQQVSRLGNPLFTEGLVAFADKDRFNRTPASQDAQFAKYARNPELATLINAVYGTKFVTTGRTDLEKIYIPEVLRVATTTDPVRLAGQAGFSRLGFIGGDTTNGVSGGWPNGRRLGDDVVDIALTAIASGPAYSAITMVGDNVPSNDLPITRCSRISRRRIPGSTTARTPGFDAALAPRGGALGVASRPGPRGGSRMTSGSSRRASRRSPRNAWRCGSVSATVTTRALSARCMANRDFVAIGPGGRQPVAGLTGWILPVWRGSRPRANMWSPTGQSPELHRLGHGVRRVPARNGARDHCRRTSQRGETCGRCARRIRGRQRHCCGAATRRPMQDRR